MLYRHFFEYLPEYSYSLLTHCDLNRVQSIEQYIITCLSVDHRCIYIHQESEVVHLGRSGTRLPFTCQYCVAADKAAHPSILLECAASFLGGPVQWNLLALYAADASKRLSY